MSGKCVLVVDDDDRILFMTKELLEMDGHRVVTHNRALGTSNVVYKERPDLILLDVNMPGLSGDKLAEILREDSYAREAQVVFYSSNDEDSLRQLAVAKRVSGYICKGDLIQLRNRVSILLKSRTDGAGPQGCERLCRHDTGI